MAQRTIQSPGVEINEVDLSLGAVNKIGTNIFVTGFSPQGPSDEIVQVSSLSEFEQIYGSPTNSAERYFYHTVAQSFNSRANILVNRLPYGTSLGDGFTNKYFATVYPVVPVNKNGLDSITAGFEYLSANIDVAGGQTTAQFSPASSGDIVYYMVGKPTFLALSQAQYNGILDDSAIQWSNDASVSTGWAGNFSINTGGATVRDQLSALDYAGIIILNTAKTTINNRYEGYYNVLLDNTNIYSTTNYDDVVKVKVSTDESTVTQQYSVLQDVPDGRLNFALSANYNSDVIQQNISEVSEKITTFNVATTAFDDTLVYGLYKLRTSVFSPEVIKLDFVLEEGYFGSVDYYRQINSEQGGTPISYYLPQKFANNSVNSAMKINPNISGKFSGTQLTNDGEPTRKIRIVTDELINREYTGNNATNAYNEIVGMSSDAVSTVSSGSSIYDTSNNTRDAAHGFGAGALLPAAKYSTTKSSNNKIGNIPGKLDRVFDRLSNQDIFDIDILPEAGLGTINTTILNSTDSENVSNEYFDDRDSLKGLNQLSATNANIPNPGKKTRADWNTIQTKFINLAENTRKDFIYISDPIRQIFVLGENTKQINVPGNTFPLDILAPVKQCYSLINTNYAAAYGSWAQVYDNTVTGQVWIPMSGLAAAKYAQTDATYAPWYAPAGFSRGLLNTINDIAIYPNQKQRDSLYDQANVNPVAFFPSEGFVIYGQKTLQTKPSAFDRINVRRLFLYLEKRVKETVKYFVFEPNTLFTRTNVLNVINPILEDAKNNEGLFDYLVICDERNNTPEVIDANELVVDIYLKPVRAAEFILVNFYATRTGQDFSEIVG